MKKIFPSEKIYISESKIPNSGRGVFAKKNIKKRELVERCPIINVSKNDTSNLNESILVTYFFYYGKKKEKLAFMLGFGSLYNHSYKPNIIYKLNEKEKMIDFIANTNIKKDDELTFNYKAGNPNSKAPLWFE